MDDAVIWIARFANGALGTFEATRFAGGRKNWHRWEINGSKGSIGWTFEDMNVLEYWKAGEGTRQGFRTRSTMSPHRRSKFVTILSHEKDSTHFLSIFPIYS